MRICWAHNPEVRPSFRVLKDQLISVSQGLLNDWLSLLHCLRLSSPSGRSSIGIPRSPLQCEELPLTNASRSSSTFSSSTLPASLRVRNNKKYLPSVEELRNLTLTLRNSQQQEAASSSDRVSLSSSSTIGCHSNQATSSNSPKVCDICSSYGRTWIEICKIIRAAKGNWSNCCRSSSSLFVVLLLLLLIRLLCQNRE